MAYRSGLGSPKLDGRTLIARRQCALAKAFILALGGDERVSPVQMADIKRAAELVALAESTRSRVMRAGAASAGELTALVRLEGTAARAQRALCIKAHDTAAPASLADYLATRARKIARRQSGEAA
ncbi:hypothetical protein ACVME8_007687 [Bradyrhizobium diazoefficiens]